MKTVFSIFILLLMANIATAQNALLKAEMIKMDNQYLKTLPDGKVECAFYLHGIQSNTQAANLEKYIRGYRGVEEFNLIFDNAKNAYKAQGTFYNQANWNYFKYLFKLIKVEQVNIDNQWKNLEQINNL
ncbi:MAG: hypothetical protein HPY79_03250 [Bacteroidales bacterium]|nr:hypothetical protein [Bacteroidales bacterium]